MPIRNLLIAIACLGVCVGLFLLLQRHRVEAALLRADPAVLPVDARLMAFARGRGESIYATHCARCHGASGRGDTTRGIPDLGDKDWLYGQGTVSDIEQVVTYGIRSYHPKAWNLALMPAYGTPRPSARDSKIPALSPGNIRDLVRFLRYQQGSDLAHGEVTDSAAVTRGAALFAGVGGCYDCHGADGKGDPAIGAPNLTDQINLYGDGSAEALALSISYGRAGVCPAWIQQLGPAGVREVAVYVYAMSQRGS